MGFVADRDATMTKLMCTDCGRWSKGYQVSLNRKREDGGVHGTVLPLQCEINSKCQDIGKHA